MKARNICLSVAACVLMTVTFMEGTAFSQEKYPFQDASLPVEERVEDLIGRMTVEEKIDMLSCYKNWYVHPCERLGVPAFQMVDGPTGVGSWGLFGRSTAYPASIAVAASWNRELAGELGAMYAEEWRARGFHFLLAPGANIYRASKAARNFEYFGEDPYLTSEMIVPFIQGVQDGGVIATVKHYAANDQEFDRYRVSTEVSERTLREIYLPPFEAAVKKAGVRAVMTGYNLVNGTYCTENKHLIDILKGEWGFDGILMSDWGCVFSDNAAINGLDMEMGSNSWLIREKIIPLLESGKIDTAAIDDKARRIYTACMRTGFFDRPQKVDSIPLFNAEANALAYKAATEGVVMLKNDGILPLDKGKVKKIAVIGPNATSAIISDSMHDTEFITYGGGGSSRVHPWYVVSPLEGIMREFPDAEILFDEGIASALKQKSFKKGNFFHEDGQYGLKGKYADGRTGEGKSFVQTDYTVDFEWAALPPAWGFGEYFKAEWTGYLIPDKDGKIIFFLDAQGGCRLELDGETVVDMVQNPSYLSEIITVEAKEGEKIPVKLEYFNNRCLASEVRLGYIHESEVDFSEALKAAEEADVTIFCGGLNGYVEKEGRDRPFELGYGQDELIGQLSSVTDALVVVLNAGGGVRMSAWVDKVPAILHAFYPGQEGGRAIASILSGKVNPSAKLPFSIEREWEDSPAAPYYDQDRESRKVHYTEGIFMGYRGYDKSGIEPLFPFGFGLSYTDFVYSDLKVVKKDTKNHIVEVECSIRNAGNVGGYEIAQLYVRDEVSSEERPEKELKGFDKVWIEPGMTEKVSFILDERAFSYFSEKEGKWVLETGRFEILVGPSSADLPLRTEIEFNLF